MGIATVTATVELEGGVSHTQTFVLERSDASTYGNGTSVRRVYPNGYEDRYDTRYDTSLRRDGSNFAGWVEDFLRSGSWVRPLVNVTVR